MQVFASLPGLMGPGGAWPAGRGISSTTTNCRPHTGQVSSVGAAERKGREVLGVEKILAQDPCQPLGSGTGTPAAGAPAAGKKDPAPMLFFSKIPGVARAMACGYQDFLDAHMSGFAQMIEAAERGYLLDPLLCLPEGSFPPTLIPSILQASAGFNPETAYPRGCFPRAWPSIGGKLSPPPRRPSKGAPQPGTQAAFTTAGQAELIVM